MGKAQTAIEYLMTYGWAILIVVIILGVLYSVGAFNPSTYSSRLLPGSCQVSRPYGPATIQIIALQGVCSDGLPKSLPYFSNAGQINITNSVLVEANTLTLSVWIDVSSPGYWTAVSRGAAGSAGSFAITNQSVATPSFVMVSPGGSSSSLSFSSTQLKINTWYNLIATFNQKTGTENVYLNGQLANTQSASLGTSTSNVVVAAMPGLSGMFTGFIGDVQMYNTSLQGNSISLLYDDGVGAAPVQLQNLVGWWPLNGDINDYSGDGLNGIGNGFIYTQTWSDYYSTP